MKTSTKFILGVAAVILIAALGFIFALYVTKPQIITQPVPILTPGKDSLIVKHYYHTIHDTIKAEVKNDTASTSIYREQIFDKDTIKSKTDIRYVLSDSTFDINQSFDYVKTKEYRVDTLKIEIPVPTPVEVDQYFFEKPYFNFIAGVLITITIFFLSGG